MNRIHPVKSWLFLLCGFCFLQVAAQPEPAVIRLESKPAAADMVWQGGERSQQPPGGGGPIVSNVSEPSLLVFRPEAGTANGTAVIIAPGGGFHLLSMSNEGTEVARWCNSRGITAFVLKYRLVPTGEDPGGEFMAKVRAGAREMDREIAPYIYLAKADGLAALEYVREHAGEYGVAPEKVGIIGFSAGGTVAGAAALEYTSAANRPDFAAPIYGALQVLNLGELPENPMPLFLAVTGDDVFGFQTLSLDMYRTWNAGGHPVELHVYERGGHGFGMREQGLPSDAWTDAFAAWLTLHGLLE